MKLAFWRICIFFAEVLSQTLHYINQLSSHFTVFTFLKETISLINTIGKDFSIHVCYTSSCQLSQTNWVTLKIMNEIFKAVAAASELQDD